MNPADELVDRLVSFAGSEDAAVALLTQVYTDDGTGSTVFDERMAAARRSSVPVEEVVGDLPVVAPGVRADIAMRGDVVFINIVWSEMEGQGNVSRWLDSLEGKTLICPAVLSTRMANILRHKGFRYIAGTDSWVRT